MRYLIHHLFVFVILLALNGCTQLQVKNNPTSHNIKEINSIDEFPDKLWELNKCEMFNYERETPGGGFSVRYCNPYCVMDIYIYDLQIDHIPNNINDVIVVDVFNKTMCQIIDMYSTDEYENLIHSEGFLKDIGHQKMWFLEMAFTSKSVDKYSVLGMTVFEDNLFKIRITTPKSELNSHKYRVNKIIKSIGDHFFKNILTMHSMGNPGPGLFRIQS